MTVTRTPTTDGAGTAGRRSVDDLVLRPGSAGDLDALAELVTSSRWAAVPMMPPHVHTAAEDRAWIERQLAGEREVWVAEASGRLVGYVVLEPAWLHSLYVHPDLKRQGLGSVMLDLVKGLRPDGFSLWVFVSNMDAQAFYRRHGLVEVRRTDGSDNDEGAPDIEMSWAGDRRAGEPSTEATTEATTEP